MQNKWLERVIFLIFGVILAVGLTKVFGPEHRVDPSVAVPEVRVDRLPGVITPGDGTVVDRIKDRIIYRERDAEIIYKAPASDKSEDGNYRVIETIHRDTIFVPVNNLEQVSLRSGRVSVYTHEDTVDSRVDFSVNKYEPFDVYMENGEPKVRTLRCSIVCDPQVSLEGGYLLQVERQAPYVAAEASVASLSRSIRLFIRPELNMTEAQIRAGVRYVF